MRVTPTPYPLGLSYEEAINLAREEAAERGVAVDEVCQINISGKYWIIDFYGYPNNERFTIYAENEIEHVTIGTKRKRGGVSASPLLIVVFSVIFGASFAIVWYKMITK